MYKLYSSLTRVSESSFHHSTQKIPKRKPHFMKAYIPAPRFLAVLAICFTIYFKYTQFPLADTSAATAEDLTELVAFRGNIQKIAEGKLSRDEEVRYIQDLSLAVASDKINAELIGIPSWFDIEDPSQNWLGRLKNLSDARQSVRLEDKIVALQELIVSQKRKATPEEIKMANADLEELNRVTNSFFKNKGATDFVMYSTPYDLHSVQVTLDRGPASTDKAKRYRDSIVTGKDPYWNWSPGP